MSSTEQLDLLTRVAIAIERADQDGNNIPEGTTSHPEVSSWSEHLARAALNIVIEEAARVVRDEAKSARHAQASEDRTQLKVYRMGQKDALLLFADRLQSLCPPPAEGAAA